MNIELLSSLKKILRENGTDALDNIKLVGSVLGGNAAVNALPECDALILCLMADYHKELIFTDEALRDSAKKTIAGRLCSNEGLDAGLCNRTLDILEAAFFGNEPAEEEKLAESGAARTSSTPEKTEQADTAAEIKNLQTVIEGYKKQNARLVKEIRHTAKQKKQSYDKNPGLEKSIKKMKNKFAAALVFLGISIVIIFAVYVDMSEKNTSLLVENLALSGEITALENRYASSKIIWAINVTDMEVGNANQYNQWVTMPGNLLKASEVQYLNPVFIYYSPVSGSLTFYIKIKDSLGTVIRGEKSPEGFSYSCQYQVKRGSSLKFDPGGFGAAGGGYYSPGIWTIELWYEEFCLYSGEVKLE
jgi:hypothetical protein